MNNKKTELLVAALENGTVIDHIPSELVFTIAQLLELDKLSSSVTIGYNLNSQKIGKKGVIKVADKFFSDEEISRLSVVAPNVVLNIIRNFDVVEKEEVIIPDELHGIVRCGNPKCISNNEPMNSFFHVVDKENGVLKCHYCEKEQNKDKVKLV